MTEPNDRPTELPVEVEPSKTHKSNKVFRLGISCLALLLVTALIFVGGTFSKNTSKGSFVGLSIQAAEFNLTVEDTWSGSDIDRLGSFYGFNGGNEYVVLCSFEVNYTGDVDISCDLVFHVSTDRNLDSDVQFQLYNKNNLNTPKATLALDEDKSDVANKQFVYFANDICSFEKGENDPIEYVIALYCPLLSDGRNTTYTAFAEGLVITATQLKTPKGE